MVIVDPESEGRMNRGKAVVICSGGLDSTTLLYYVKDLGYVPHVLSFDYGQKHNREILYAKRICKRLGVVFSAVTLPRLGGSSLTDRSVEVPKEDYSIETQKSTVVPNRNMIFLSIAAAYAISIDARNVYYAAHFNDEAIYPDCRPQFVSAMNIALLEGNDKPIGVVAPFLNFTKAKVVEIGVKLKVPFVDTWSCYDPQTVSKSPVKSIVMHCGVCGTCRERKLAFERAGVDDPTEYAK